MYVSLLNIYIYIYIYIYITGADISLGPVPL